MTDELSVGARSSSWPVWGMTATAVVEDPGALSEACRVLEEELAAADLACSRFRDDSELTLINAAQGKWAPASALFVEHLQAALIAAAISDGAVDPTLGAALRSNGYDRDITLVGGPAQTSLVVRYVGPRWREVEVDAEGGRVRLPPGVELDLGATAKALTSDRAAIRAHQIVGSPVLVNLGGDLAVAGCGTRTPFPVVVAENHREMAGPMVYVGDGGMATSTTRLRRWTLDGTERHHLVDPHTGLPAVSPWQTVTVSAQTCVAANTASTAAIVLGRRARPWLESHGVPARLVGTDGAVVTLNGWPDTDG
ncbi:MAG: FAD:protein FMN transferase [Actinobacteria bacterium]|nr:FAD:protein FMN transferase [Actinomycetota bacterium]MBI3687948.1 FAD:protein FMN transferase [Actinomycetota bacterium]